jgi:hypothetical protein
MADALLSTAVDAAAAANALSYVNRLRTMLHWLALLVERMPNYVLFLPLGGENDHAHARHNEETLLRFSVFIRQHGSIAPGRSADVLRSDSVTAVISTLRAYRSLEARYQLRRHGGDLCLLAFQKAMRREDGPAMARALRLGIRSADFKVLRDISERNRRSGGPVWDAHSRDGIMRNCAATLAHSVVARGGELGLVEGQKQHEFDPACGFVIGDIVWKEPRVVSGGYPWAMVSWFPIKDRQQKHKKHPMPVSRRHHGPPGSDPQCPYDALAAAWRIRAGEVPREAWGRTPFFVTAAGKIYDTGVMRDIARDIATLIGIPPEEAGGTAFRIGGASCLRESHGEAEAKRLLVERGRWQSDIGLIYARMSISTHLTASRTMTHAAGADVERETGWAQPAR